jgi:hypothetical protein
MARRRAAEEELTAEETAFLETCKTRDSLFPDIDLRWWSQVEHPA